MPEDADSPRLRLVSSPKLGAGRVLENLKLWIGPPSGVSQ